MFIPLHDANSLKHIRLQYVTISLIALNCIVFFITMTGDLEATRMVAYGYGYVPAVVNEMAVLPPELERVPGLLTYVTYAFLHGDIFHLGGNMLFLWVFGDNVEDALGHFRFLVFYMLCAAAGAWLHGSLIPGSEMPLIGASGAVAGIVAAYLVLHPRVKLWVLVFFRIPLRIPAMFALGLWVLFQFGMLLLGGEDQISWAAHVGGIVAGALLVPVLKRRAVPLFDRRIVTPEAVEVEGSSAPAAVEPPAASRWGRQ